MRKPMEINGVPVVETPYTRLMKEKLEREKNQRRRYGLARSAGESLGIPVGKDEKKPTK